MANGEALCRVAGGPPCFCCFSRIPHPFHHSPSRLCRWYQSQRVDPLENWVDKVVRGDRRVVVVGIGHNED